MRERRPVSANARRARALLLGNAAGGHVVGLICVVAFTLARGPASGAWAALAAVVTIAFAVVGLGVQVAVADAPARTVLFAAMSSYLVRVVLLGLLLQLAMVNSERFASFDPVALAGTTIAVVIGGLATEFWVYSRLRIPIYDEPEATDWDRM